MPTISLTVDATQTARIATAFGRYWNLQNPDGSVRDATLAEVRDWLRRQLVGVVITQERELAAAQANVPDVPVT